MINSKRRRSKSPFRMITRSSHSPSPSTTTTSSLVSTVLRSGSGRSTPNTMNGIATSLEETKRASPAKDSPSQTPDRRSVASSTGSGSSGGILTPSSTMEGLTTPCLPKVVHVRKCNLRKRPPDDPVSGWGFVLRGTTSEFKSGVKVYTCHVETVKDDSAAMNAGIKEGDQIVAVDGVQVKEFQHLDTVRIFQSKDKVELTLLPSKFKLSTQVRVTDFNRHCLSYLWSLTMCLQSLEIVNVKVSPQDVSPFLLDLSNLPGLRHLAVNHCHLEKLSRLQGLHALRRLESLSLAHNFLSIDSFLSDTNPPPPLSSLSSLKRLDLSYNLLSAIPPVILTLSNIETLVLVDNNISELPSSLKTLKKLTTLCIDGNLLREVDSSLEVVPQLKMVTMADNQFDTEPYCIKHQSYVITCIQGNPYITGNGKRHQEYYLRRSYSTKGVFKSQDSTHIRRISAAYADAPSIPQLEQLTTSLSSTSLPSSPVGDRK